MKEATWNPPSDAAIKAILAERIDKQRDGVGIVVGVIDRDGQRVVAHGRHKRGGRHEVDGDTLFEIGSITKVFTSLLLSDMALRGEVALNDPVAKHLPEGVSMPERGGRVITLADLATHRSGLPWMPTNFAREDLSNPHADYTNRHLDDFLNGHVLDRHVGARWVYSNLGAGLLGNVLARRLGTDYETLVRGRITGPLGLRDTAIQLSADLRKRLAQGHAADRGPAPNTYFPEVLAGAGAIRSTTHDLLAFLAVSLGYRDGPLKPAMDAQLAFPLQATDRRGLSQGLGWRAFENERGRVVFHGGLSGGSKTFMGLNLALGWGAVVLTNTRNGRGGADIARHVLMGTPLGPAPRRTRSPGTEDVLRRYVVARANGQPNYDDLEPPLAERQRGRWPSREAIIQARGAVKSITFVRVDYLGNDVYDVIYEKGRVEWSISPLGPNGKVAVLRPREIPGDLRG